ncbi:MAG: hypothetical protein H3C27_16350 [Opitutaceae bacterium]|nr:hypothetical protein [Opitutaceae bacterium]
MTPLHPRRTVAWLAGIAAGITLWAVSRPVFGVQEPWDGSLLRYGVLVAVSGAACALIASPRRRLDVLGWPAAFLVGELAYMATQPDRWSLWPLALIALAVGAIPAVFGVALVHKFLGGVAA